MLDINLIRAETEKVKDGLRRRRTEIDIDGLLAKDEHRRELITALNSRRAERNRVSKEIGEKKRAGEDVSAVVARMGELAKTIRQGEAELRDIEAAIEEQMLWIPNLPADSAPDGGGPEDNVVTHTGGPERVYEFTPRPHWDLGRELDILDFERAAKIVGSGFTLYKGAGARLERALFNYMVDLHTTAHGYRELFTPFLVNRASLQGTGQLPKAEEDMYRCEVDDLFLIPTAEVSVTNVHRDEILTVEDLPVRYAAYSACFRREAGAYGKNTRGLMRVHQFNKVELVRFERPDKSYGALEELLGHAEAVIQNLGLKYRVVELCTSDLSFAAAKCYDLELWAPGIEMWMEVSSCSNFEDFQARRCNIRFRDEDGKVRFIHTLNGSGVATARTLLAIVETYQRADGTLKVPKVLQPYMGGMEVIS